MNWQEKFEKKFITMDGVDGYDFNLNVEAGEVREFIGDLLKERDEEWKTKLDYIDAQFSHINSFEHSETMPILREYRDMIEELYKKLNLIK